MMTPLTGPLLLLGAIMSVEGHGYLKSPRARQVVAAEDGVSANDTNADVLPPIDFCPHCSLVGGPTYGVCGRTGVNTRDYTFDWKTASGLPMPWSSEITLQEGGLITVESVFNTNHGGHIVVSVCANVLNPTQACFDANRLEFVEDALYGAPKDIHYPERGYLAPQTRQHQLTRHVFRLPMGVTGEKVLLQWHWVSNLGCRSPGYDSYPWPIPAWEPYGNKEDVCALPMPDIGNLPQQYWQCSEITITPGTPVAPTPTAPINAPVTAAPTSCNIETDGCCSIGPGGCPAWDSPCFTFDKCGKTHECSWNAEMKWVGCGNFATLSPVAPVPVTPVPVAPILVFPVPIAPIPATPVPVTPVPVASPLTPIPVTPVPITPTVSCNIETDGCCSIGPGGCPSWNSPCFTFEKCGKTQECSWNAAMKWIGCQDDYVSEGCCAQHGVCTTWGNDCFTKAKCGVEDPFRGIYCSWGGSLAWLP